MCNLGLKVKHSIVYFIRTKLLHSLVPGCDQITGKARILDEIITYVQLLKNQVECLTAQLAQFPSAKEPSSIQFWSLADATPTSASILLTEGQKASLIRQDGGSFVTWRMLD
ncbi:transcription factor bHLH137-like [Pyrus ussuriensis x Pyrus communis]|uniref:Transcription factor bHLH137-like n=1 Tax=Pyrus ussuriensis x Pyrus communis TaxID=2448454 RepID=A0A5N5HBL0_9ROSA|nr:transcription factor bHLH137-like [Pyrus ussuriensis x Pyrus communis]